MLLQPNEVEERQQYKLCGEAILQAAAWEKTSTARKRGHLRRTRTDRSLRGTGYYKEGDLHGGKHLEKVIHYNEGGN